MISGIGAADSLLQQLGLDGVQARRKPVTGILGALDSDSSSSVSQSELQSFAQGLSQLTGTDTTAESITGTYDKDSNGELNRKELHKALIGLGVLPPPSLPFTMAMQGAEQGGIQQPQGKGLFADLDTDSSGGLSLSEFEKLAQAISKTTGTQVDAAAAMTGYDADSDGVLSGQELHQAMTGLGVTPPPPPQSGQMSQDSANSGNSDATSSVSTYQAKRGKAMYELNAQDTAYQKILYYVSNDAADTEGVSVTA